MVGFKFQPLSTSESTVLPLINQKGNDSAMKKSKFQSLQQPKSTNKPEAGAQNFMIMNTLRSTNSQKNITSKSNFLMANTSEAKNYP
jgi:hypothetical protein